MKNPSEPSSLSWIKATVVAAVITLVSSAIKAETPEFCPSQSESEILRLKRILPYVRSLRDSIKLSFFLLDTDAGDASRPYRTLLSRIKEAFELLAGNDVEFISGGLEFQKLMFGTQSFCEPRSILSYETNVITTANGLQTNVIAEERLGLAQVYLLRTNLPRYAVEAQLVDACEESKRVVSRRGFISLLVGNFSDAVTLEGSWRWRESRAQIKVVVNIIEIRSGFTVASSSVTADIVKKERSQGYSARYSSRAAASLDLDSSVSETLEGIITEAVLHTFGFAVCNLIGIPTSKISWHTVDERNRSYVEGAWANSSLEWRMRAATAMNRLAAQADLAPFSLTSKLAAVRWRDWVEKIPFPSEPFSRYPLAKVGRSQLRIIFEAIPPRRWETLRRIAVKILSEVPNTAVESDRMEPEIAFCLKPIHYWGGAKLDPTELRRIIASKWEEATGSSLDSYVADRTLHFKFRERLPDHR